MVQASYARLVGVSLTLLVFLRCWDGQATEPQGRGRGVMLPYSSLSLNGQVSWAALSPDGRSIAATVLLHDADPQGNQGHLQIWDIDEHRVIAEKPIAQAPISFHLLDPRFVQYSHDGRSIVLYDGEAVVVLETQGLSELRRIDLGLPLPRPAKGVIVTGVTGVETSGDARRAAVLISKGPFAGGKLQVYDLRSGELGLERRFDSGVELGGGARVAWSPESGKLALTWLPVFPGERLPHNVNNLLILEAQSGRTLAGINTGYVAGPVAFATEDTVATASLNPDPKFYGGDTIKIWDAVSGHLLREIANPPEGVHFEFAISGDGRIALGYTGLEKYDPQLHDNFAAYRQFRVWDFRTGSILGTSNRFERPVAPNEWERGKFSAGNEGLSLSMNVRGDRVLLWWQRTWKPLTVYEVKQTGTSSN